MAENDWQFVALTYTVSALRVYFRERTDVYIAGDMFVYYRKNDPSYCVAPDVYVVIGANGNQRRHSWFVWREGKAPAFVLEVASPSTWRRDDLVKRGIYAVVPAHCPLRGRTGTWGAAESGLRTEQEARQASDVARQAAGDEVRMLRQRLKI